MRCSKAKEKLALYAGGDLPEAEVSLLMAHIDDCSACAFELEQLRKAMAAVGRLGQADIPEPLPAGFSSEIYRSAAGSKSNQGYRSIIQWGRSPIVIFGGVAVVLLLVIGLAGIMRDDKIRAITQWQNEWIRTAGENRSEVPWEAMQSLSGFFGNPIKLQEWTPPGQPGVYAIMHRADSGDGAVKYTIDYCGESRRLGLYRGYPWLPQVKKRLLSQTGSIDNIYIAVILMPESTGDERRAVEEAIIKAFNPYFNRGKGA